jgi:RNA polymerase sigma-70 factor (ECF subfamily)
MNALVETFTATWSGDELPDELETRLADICARARASHPDLSFEDRELVAALAAHCPDSGVLDYLDRCHGSELALARAAGRGDPTAIAAIEHAHHRTIEIACQRFASESHSASDLRQLLREKLFVGGSPTINDYAGQGYLDSWLRVTSMRLFLNLGKRKDRVREQPVADKAIAGLADPSDLGLELIKHEYRAAVHDALEDAARSLAPGDRVLLRQHLVAGLTIDELAVMLSIHRATAARRIAKAREQLAALTRERLAAKLELAPDAFNEVFGLVVSRLDVSVRTLLATAS